MFNPGQDCCTLPTPHCYNSLFAVLDENYNRIPYTSGQLQTDQKPIGRYAPCSLQLDISNIATQANYSPEYWGSCTSLNSSYILYQTQEGGLTYRGIWDNPESTSLSLTFFRINTEIWVTLSLSSQVTLSGFVGNYYNYGFNIWGYY
jgi:hypothetical protein